MKFRRNELKVFFYFCPNTNHTMKSSQISPKFIFVSIAILIAALSRLFPHLPNFTPVAAIALFGGAFLPDKRSAFLIPFAAMIISDLFLGFSASTFPVYFCFAFTVILGLALREKVSVLSVAAASLLSSIVFFLATNLPVWYSSLSLYPNTLEGTMESYTAALPFFSYTVAGDLFYTAILFSLFSVAQKNIPALVKSKV